VSGSQRGKGNLRRLRGRINGSEGVGRLEGVGKLEGVSRLEGRNLWLEGRVSGIEEVSKRVPRVEGSLVSVQLREIRSLI
jgi:hypothetical protein